MTTTINIIDQDIFTILRAFIASIVPTGTEIVQAQDNKVPMPVSAFVAMNNIGQTRLNTNINKWASTGSPTSQSTETHVEYRMQVDCYGEDASSWAAMIANLFRDNYATDFFASLNQNIQPLYADNPIQIPLITGENQYLQRWRMVAVMQYNPVITTLQDFADTLTINVVSVDAQYPPS